jgi:DNA mismatch repair protein MutL
MAKIKILPEEIRNQIAAGEVVERPASVIKELLDNAIDAGATQININIKNGGIQLIEISDNGEGIDKESLPLTFAQHATSKINSINDLVEINTMGFRGEALASIGSISKTYFTKKIRRSKILNWKIVIK